VLNTGPATTNGWSVTLTLPSGQSIGNMWGGVRSANSGTITVANEAWNGRLGPNATAVFGYILTSTGGTGPPTNVTCTTT
jgi:hypothetical protein